MPQGPGALTTLALPVPYPWAALHKKKHCSPQEVDRWVDGRVDGRREAALCPDLCLRGLSMSGLGVCLGSEMYFRNAPSFFILNVVMEANNDTELQDQL